MAVHITDKTKTGDLYLEVDGSVHRVSSLFRMPSVTMENVVDGSRTGGGVGCLNLKSFTPLGSCSSEQLLGVVTKLAEEARTSLERRTELMSQLAEMKERFADLKMELLDAKYPAGHIDED